VRCTPKSDGTIGSAPADQVRNLWLDDRTTVRLLVVTTRFPQADGKGDQLRLYSWLTHLGRRHDITVLSSGGSATHEEYEAVASLAQIEQIRASAARRAMRAAGYGARGLPAQVGWMLSAACWRRARELAPMHDAALLVTTRSIAGPLAIPIVVDHVDALSLNMRRRARGPEGPAIRTFAALEGRAFRRWERRVGALAAVQLVTSVEDAQSLCGPAPVHVVPLSFNLPSSPESIDQSRDIDLILTGNMKYPPNVAAARMLLDEIVPRARELRPELRVFIVGRAAKPFARDGVTVMSDVESVYPFLRRAKVAVVPITIGTGFPTKALEAAVSGAAIVGTPEVAARFDAPIREARNARQFAGEIERLLADDSLRARQAQQTMDAVQAYRPEIVGAQLEAILLDAADSPG
jgi:polysaccharide biosynthesis protein PslH